jgi:hypothetical protein
MPNVHQLPSPPLGKFEPTSCEKVVAQAQDILARYLDLGNNVSDSECIDQLLELLDGPVAVEITENADARREGGYRSN